jgi:hypothetical protein
MRRPGTLSLTKPLLGRPTNGIHGQAEGSLVRRAGVDLPVGPGPARVAQPRSQSRQPANRTGRRPLCGGHRLLQAGREHAGPAHCMSSRRGSVLAAGGCRRKADFCLQGTSRSQASHHSIRNSRRNSRASMQEGNTQRRHLRCRPAESKSFDTHCS